MKSARTLAVFQLGLGNRSAEINIPQRRCLLRVGLIARQVAQERRLACAASVIADGCVQQRPVDRQSKATEQIFKDFFILMRQLDTQRDEVWS